MTAFPHRFAAALAVCALTLTGCAAQQGGGARSGDPASGRQEAAADPASAPAAPGLPANELSPQLLYEFLIAEMAAQRGQYQLSARAYIDLARRTEDPRIARRATEVAIASRQQPLAVEAATLWLQAEPASDRARQTLASILVSTGTLDQVRPHLDVWLSGSPERTARAFLQINTLLARHADKAAVADLIAELATRYPDLPEARLAAAQAAWNAQRPEAALAAAREALALRPDWDLAALFQGQILQRRSPAEALAFFAEYLRANPKSKDMRLNYARLLLADGRAQDARAQYRILAEQYPEDADVGFAIGLLALQGRDFDLAEENLRRVLDLNPRDRDSVLFYLGQVQEERKRLEEAKSWYGKVSRGRQYLPAQIRIAHILGRQGRVTEARELLHGLEGDGSQRVLLAQAEGQLLREARQYREAFEMLGERLAAMPDSIELLYDHAMAAEKVDRLDVLEKNLRRLLELKPDHAHAYNALGYTLADRTDRLQEAYDLIDKALKLAPDDPFILDSMGWVLYRLGRLEEGRGYLERAFRLRPDPEIAAHLGEVLWVQGRHDEAKQIWSTALAEHPDNELLRAVIEKFKP